MPFSSFLPLYSTSFGEVLSSFGEGISLYFLTLRALSFMLLFAGLINLPFIEYYTSDRYNHNKRGMVPFMLRGTAICTDMTWEPCPTCTKSQWDHFPRAFDRYGETTDGSLRFIKVNNCSISYLAGLLSYLSLLLVFFGMAYLSIFILKKREFEVYKAQQTTSKYSIKVENPPKDARDAEEWRTFFSQFGHVSCCTVALNNGELIRALVRKKILVIQLHQLLPSGVNFDKHNLVYAVENAMPLKWWQKLMLYSDAESLKQQILNIENEIQDMSEKDYDVCRVFVSMEKELYQRKALVALSVPRSVTLTTDTSALPTPLSFRGNHVLRVGMPPEPLAVKWAQFGTPWGVSIYLPTEETSKQLCFVHNFNLFFSFLMFAPPLFQSRIHF